MLAPIGVYGIADQIKNPPPLLQAILDNRIDDAARLLEQGASATARYHKIVPYFVAAASLRPCDPRMLDLLIAHGANVNGVWITLPGRHGDSPFDAYISPLAAAASAGSDACVATLIRHGADPNIVSLEGVTPLGAAAGSMYCKPEMVDFLLKHGADPNLTPSLDDLPPKVVGHIMSGLGNLPGPRKRALAAKFRPTLKVPALDLAVAYARPACARALIMSGANVEAQGMEGTLLTDAVSIGRSPAITRMLLLAGADVHARNEQGETPLFMGAADFGSPDSPKIFSQYCVECASMLINAGAEVDAVDKTGNTPLVYAADGEDALPLVRLLVDAGADVNYRNPKTGMTPLRSAQSAHNAAVVSFLISRGATASSGGTEGKPAGTP
ncbi:MAG: ankyrin repeat domain-containing protein [Gammaproteobacteria bacterium]